MTRKHKIGQIEPSNERGASANGQTTEYPNKIDSLMNTRDGMNMAKSEH